MIVYVLLVAALMIVISNLEDRQDEVEDHVRELENEIGKLKKNNY